MKTYIFDNKGRRKYSRNNEERGGGRRNASRGKEVKESSLSSSGSERHSTKVKVVGSSPTGNTK